MSALADASLSQELIIVLCVLGVFLLLLSVLMVFLCFECLRRRNNAEESGTAAGRLSWLTFLNFNPKADSSAGIFTLSKHKEQPGSAEKYVLKDTTKTLYHVDLVPPPLHTKPGGIYKSVTQDSDTESQFSFSSEGPENQRGVTLFWPPGATSCGSVHVSIKFYHFANRLAVRVGEVKLKLIDNIVVNPYVKLHLVPEHRRGNRQTTRVKRNSAFFVCDEDFLFGVGSREVRTKSLSLQIFDYKSNTRHLCIGCVVIDLEEFNFKDDDKPVTLKRPILPFRNKQDSFGSLLLSACVTQCKPKGECSRHSITIGIVRAEALVPVDTSGKIDPYCKILVHVGSQLIHKKKSTVSYSARSPNWEEFFTFELPDKTLLCDVSVTVELRDNLKNSRSTSYLLLGRVTLANTPASGTGHAHWHHVCSRRGETITEWHPISS